MIRLSLQSYRFYTTDLPIKMSYDCFGTSADRCTNPLIIGHGLFGQKRNWNTVAKKLQSKLNNQVFVVDFRNHGNSAHTEEHTYSLLSGDISLFINKVKKETGFDSCYLLGHSMGGKAAAHFALNSPDAPKVIKKLIIEDISPHRANTDSSIRSHINALKNLDLSKTRKEIDNDLKNYIEDTNLRNYLLMNLHKKEENEHFQWKFNLYCLEKFLSHLQHHHHTTGSFTKPTLFITGEKSDYLTEEDHKPLSKIFPNATYVVIKNASHLVHFDEPDLFVETVLNFLYK